MFGYLDAITPIYPIIPSSLQFTTHVLASDPNSQRDIQVQYHGSFGRVQGDRVHVLGYFFLLASTRY